MKMIIDFLYNAIYILIFILTPYYCFREVEKMMTKKNNVFRQIFCPPGGGKTTLAADLIRKIITDATDEGKEVYSNVAIVGAKRFDIEDLGKFDIRNCVLIIDEAGSKLSNRNWQHNLNLLQIELLKLHRHLHIDIYLFSQAYGDVDNKFRELTTGLYMLKKSKWIPFRISAKAIVKNVDLINGQIVEFYEWDTKNDFGFWTVPNWAWFNTHQVDIKLPQKIWTRWRKNDCV